ncbi:O-antigen ligase family protein [Patescibacteria group bacterium]
MRKLFENAVVLKYATTLTILSVLLLPKFPLIRVPGTFVSIRIEDLAVFVTTVLFAYHFFGDRKEIWNYRVTKYSLIYISAGLVSLVSAVFLTRTTLPHIGFLHLLRRIEYLIPLFVGIYLVRANKANLEYFIKIFMIVILYAFIYGIGQRYFNWPIVITQNLEYSKGVALRWIEGSHINSTFAGHYDLAAYLVLVLPVVVGVFSYTKTMKSKISFGITIFGGLWLLGFAASRISIVAYLVAVVFALILSKRYKLIPIIVLISVLIFGLSPNLRARYDRFFSVLKDRVSVVVDDELGVYATQIIPNKREQATPTPTPIPVFEDRSTSIRLKAAWPKAFRAIEKNPLLGTGYSSVTLAVDNNYLRILGEVGIIGFAGWLLLFLGIIRSFVDVFPFTKELKGVDVGYVSSVAAAIVGVLLIALFIDIYLASKFAIIYWFVIGMALGVIRNSGKEI